MKLSFNGATTMKADLATDVSAVAPAEFDYLEIQAAKLREFLKTHSVKDLKTLFDENKLKPLSISPIEYVTFRDVPAYARIKAECEELCSIAAAIGCPYVVIIPGNFPPGGLSSYEVIEETVGVLRELASIAERHNVALAFEFLGQKDCRVQTLELADEIVQKVNRRNIGLVIDSFHFYVGGSTIKMIDAIDPKRLFIFQISDAENLPLDRLTDAHRLLPGLSTGSAIRLSWRGKLRRRLKKFWRAPPERPLWLTKPSFGSDSFRSLQKFIKGRPLPRGPQHAEFFLSKVVGKAEPARLFAARDNESCAVFHFE